MLPSELAIEHGKLTYMFLVGYTYMRFELYTVRMRCTYVHILHILHIYVYPYKDYNDPLCEKQPYSREE